MKYPVLGTNSQRGFSKCDDKSAVWLGVWLTFISIGFSQSADWAIRQMLFVQLILKHEKIPQKEHSTFTNCKDEKCFNSTSNCRYYAKQCLSW